MRLWYGIILVFAMGIVLLSFAYSYAQEEGPMRSPTDNESIDVEISLSPMPLEPDQETRMHIRFLQKDRDVVQPHIDYQVYVKNNGEEVFRIPLTHTNPGIVTIPYTFTSTGSHTIGVEVEGILFQPIPEEVVEFSVNVVPEFPLSVMVVAAAVIAVSIFATRRMNRGLGVKGIYKI